MTDDEVNFAYAGVVERYMEAMATENESLEVFTMSFDVRSGVITEAELRHTIGHSTRWRVRRAWVAMMLDADAGCHATNRELDAMMLDAAVANTEDGQRRIKIKEFVNMLSANPQQFQGE